MKTAIRARNSAFTLGLCVALFSSAVFAQTPEERAGARNAARSGLKSYEAGKYADALDLFSRAENLVHAPTHLLYIARANVKLGHLVRAQEAYQQLIREKLPANAPQPFRDAQQNAEQELDAFEARIATITINVSGADTTGLQVTIDGKPIPAALIGIPYPADPGTHRFTARAPGFIAAPVEKTLSEGSRERLDLTLVPDPNSAPVPPPPAGDTVKDAEPGPKAKNVDFTATPEPKSSNKAVAITALAVGGVGVAAGIYFFTGYKSADDDATKKFNTCAVNQTGVVCSDADRKAIDDLDAKASTQGWLSIISFSVGGLAAATGVTLLILDSSKSESKTATTQSANMRVWAGPGSLGLAGRF